jgi:DNA-binding beta-propeller fold protein YncE
LIDVASGDSKAITPEGISGTMVSPDGKQVAVTAPDGKQGIWPLDGSGFRPIPGLNSNYSVCGWSPDGHSVYVALSRYNQRVAKVYSVNPVTGKMDLWRTFSAPGSGVTEIDPAEAQLVSSDGRAYAYTWSQDLGEAYVITGLR